ncbi:MAG TPA: zinc-dependent metalloprotease [Acidimicrobiia bacterium]|jgi:putative hydrolase|nr:zinc-dependent metalloprotease [Acidimicrobiia bacterium]
MSDDLFSKLFELFNQPGPVNWKLAAEVARHLSGERQPVEPWAAEEFRELARLAEYRLEEVAPFPVRPAVDVLPLDPRSWAEKNLELYGSLVEPFATSMGGEAAPMMAQIAPAMIGLQVGSLVGGLSAWVVAGFDAGLPPDREGPLSLVVPHIEALRVDGVDPREVRLWVVANEVAFRAVSEVPWVRDHLAHLVTEYAAAAQIDPTRLSGLVLGGTDPAAIEQAIAEAGGLEGLIGGEEAEAPRAELEAFLGTVAGCSRLLARRAVADMGPHFDRVSDTRDLERDEFTATPTIGVGPVPSEAVRLGDAFNQEVERRYGDDALQTLWSDPSRMPSAAELRDPTAWAARVLLDGWT